VYQETTSAWLSSSSSAATSAWTSRGSAASRSRSGTPCSPSTPWAVAPSAPPALARLPERRVTSGVLCQREDRFRPLHALEGARSLFEFACPSRVGLPSPAMAQGAAIAGIVCWIVPHVMGCVHDHLWPAWPRFPCTGAMTA